MPSDEMSQNVRERQAGSFVGSFSSSCLLKYPSRARIDSSQCIQVYELRSCGSFFSSASGATSQIKLQKIKTSSLRHSTPNLYVHDLVSDYFIAMPRPLFCSAWWTLCLTVQRQTTQLSYLLSGSGGATVSHASCSA